MDLVNQFHKLAEEHGATFETINSQDESYLDCSIVKDEIHIYITFTKFRGNFMAYSLNSDIAPSELYMETKDDSLDIRKKRNDNILNNVNLFLSGGLVYVKKPSFFDKERGYIDICVEENKLRIWQKENVWNLPTK